VAGISQTSPYRSDLLSSAFGERFGSLCGHFQLIPKKKKKYLTILSKPCFPNVLEIYTILILNQFSPREFTASQLRMAPA
jgi:hypothetical protein